MNDEKKKVKQAVALEYDPSDEAPRVIASGKGILAEKIIEKAQESSVPIHRDDKLADTLSRLDIGEMIPPELYEVVAEILVFVDAVDHRMVKESVANGGKHKGRIPDRRGMYMSRWLRTIWRNRECVSWNGISAEAGTVRSTLSAETENILCLWK